MAKNFFKRYIWLVDLINRRKYVSFKEINEAWMRSPLNETGDPLSVRTFFNHKDAISGMFGIEILNDRSLGYYIGRSDVGSDETSDWMLHTLCLNNVLHENADMKDRILMEKLTVAKFPVDKIFRDVLGLHKKPRNLGFGHTRQPFHPVYIGLHPR